jgi:signal transduction histidine kinase
VTVASPIAAPVAAAGSLERRLMLRLGVLYLIALAAVTATYVVLSWSNRHIEVTDDLGPITAAIGQSLRPDAAGAPRLDLSTELRRKLAKLGISGVAVIDPTSGRVVASFGATLSRSAFPAAVVSRGEEGDVLLRDRNGTTQYVALRPVGTALGPFAIELHRRRTAGAAARDWIWDEVGDEMVPVLMPLLAATLLISWFTLSTSFRPLRRLAKEARLIDGYVPGVRLGRRGVPREILPVVDAANLALDRVENTLNEQRTLITNIAHELRTPLAILRARIDGLGDPAVVEVLLPDYQRIARLVDRLLTVARLQSGRLAFETRYDLVPVVRDCLAEMAVLALSQRKDLALDAPERPVIVRGNPVALQDAVRNLVDNALRHTPPDQAIEVTIRPGSVVDIRDHGTGVPAELRHRIFEPFWRGASPGGAGLGLAIAAETARRHGGGLTVDNCSGGGAVFHLEIPEHT